MGEERQRKKMTKLVLRVQNGHGVRVSRMDKMYNGHNWPRSLVVPLVGSVHMKMC